MPEKMTELEAVAMCTAIALNGAETWAKAEADKATEHAKKLLKADRIDVDVYAKVIERCAGNHSARRQRLAAMGLIQQTTTDNAEKRAIEAAMEQLGKAEDAAMKDVLK